MKLYNLAKRIANFIWDYDPYNARDYYDSFGDAVSETLIGLSNDVQRQTIHEFLMDLIADGEVDVEYANILAREVAAL